MSRDGVEAYLEHVAEAEQLANTYKISNDAAAITHAVLSLVAAVNRFADSYDAWKELE